MRRLPLVAALALGALLIAEGALRPRLAALDAYQYADVALNLASGRGLTQSVLGYNSARFPADGTWPVAFTSQPPLYPALGSLPIRLGADPAGALAALAAAALLAAWLAASWLAREAYGEDAGTLTLLGLAACAWSVEISPRLWSEPLGVAASLATLAALTRSRRPPTGGASHSVRWALAAGLFAGLAFGARYALAPLALLGVSWLLAGRPPRARLATALSFALGWAAVAAPVLARNRALSGGWLGEARNPSAESAAAVLAGAFARTAGRLPAQALALLALSLLALLFALARDAALRSRVSLALAGGGWLTPAWLALYTGTMLLLRSRVQFDAVGFRLLAPALAAAVPLAAALWLATLRPPRRALQVAVALALVAGAANVGARLARAPRAREGARGEASPAVRWLAAHTRPGDPVIAEDGVDLAWKLREGALGSRRFASFSPAPYMTPLTADDLARFAALNVMPAGPPLRVLVRKHDWTDAEWRSRAGDVIAGAMAGAPREAELLVLEADLPDARIFRFELPGAR